MLRLLALCLVVASATPCEKLWTLAEVLGPRATIFVAPKYHHFGNSHEYLYRTFVDGTRRLVKVKAIGHGDVNAHYAAELSGMRLGAAHGGPQIFRSGVLSDARFFIEMEELFAHEFTMTYKGVRHSAATLRRAARLLGDAHARELARLARTLLERKITVVDFDFIFTAEHVRVIDTTWWTPPTARGDRRQWLRDLVRDAFRVSARFGHGLSERLRGEIKASSHLDAGDRSAALAIVNEGECYAIEEAAKRPWRRVVACGRYLVGR